MKHLKFSLISLDLSNEDFMLKNKMLKSFPLPVIKMPLLEDFPTASEEVFLLLRQRDAHAEEVCTVADTGSASDGSTKKKGRTVAITTEDMQKRRNDVKARTTLLLALSDEHQLRFSKYKTAQELWATILKTFEVSETLEQTFNRLQAIISHLEFMDTEIEQNDLNQKFLTSLSPEWLMYTIVWRNKCDFDTMNIDDVYNHLKVYKPELQKKSETNAQNMAFISSANNSSGNGEVNTASIPTVSTQVSPTSANVAAASISLDTTCAYIASQSNGSQIKYEDINQIDEDDIEEMDIKWNIALLSMISGKGEVNTASIPTASTHVSPASADVAAANINHDTILEKYWENITIQGTDVAGFDKSKVKCFNCHKMGHFATECRAPKSQDRGRREIYKQGSKEEE
nr:hypothetical protein [Tanacetum cinerariifolium]